MLIQAAMRGAPNPNFRQFSKNPDRPVWEGVIFPGVEKADSRLSILETPPCPALQALVESIWLMTWDIPKGQELACIVIPNPCAKLVVRPGPNSQAFFAGPRASAEIYRYSGSGQMLGFEFNPGALYPIVKQPLHAWREARIPAKEIFPASPADWSERNILHWITEVEVLLLEALEEETGHFRQIKTFVEGALKGAISSVEDAAGSIGMSARTAQRIFLKEVGLSPRDILRIARFNSAIREISGDRFSDFADVALASGFFDQAHMVNEFRKLVAATPAKFLRYW